MIQNMSRSEAIERMQEVSAEMEVLGDKPRLSARDDAKFLELDAEFDSLDAHRKRLERAAELAGARSGRGRLRVERGTPDDSSRAGEGLRSDALRTLDAAVSSDRLGARWFVGGDPDDDRDVRRRGYLQGPVRTSASVPAAGIVECEPNDSEFDPPIREHERRGQVPRTVAESANVGGPQDIREFQHGFDVQPGGHCFQSDLVIWRLLPVLHNRSNRKPDRADSKRDG